MSNILISDAMVQGLFDDPAIFELYRTERTIPNTIIFLQRAVKTAQTANTSTLKLLGRILHVAALAIGFLQILRPKTNVTQNQVVASLKTSCLAASNVLLTYATATRAPGNLQVNITGEAHDALKKLETYDPAFMHFLPVATEQGNRIYLEGDGVDLESHIHGNALILGIMEDYERLIVGTSFPIEALI